MHNTHSFINKAQSIHGNKYDYSKVEYVHSRVKVIIICKEHGEFKQKPVNHMGGSGCPKCRYDSDRMPLDTFIDKANNIHHNKYDYGLVEYKQSQKKVTIICQTHGIFKQTPNAHINGRGCPMCKASAGEKKIEQYLKQYNIEYVPQKRFPDCKDIHTLPFDFFLPIENICIEYDGEQHHKPVDIFGGTKAFINRQKKDYIKTEYCNKNNIDLIRIPYTDFENIEHILYDALNKVYSTCFSMSL